MLRKEHQLIEGWELCWVYPKAGRTVSAMEKNSKKIITCVYDHTTQRWHKVEKSEIKRAYSVDIFGWIKQ